MRRVLPLLFPALLAAQSPAPRSIPELKAFYAENCARCHGVDGSAIGPDGKRLKGMDFLDTRALSKATDEELTKRILKGIGWGLVMPGFKDRLSPEDAKRMVTELIRKAEKGRPL